MVERRFRIELGSRAVWVVGLNLAAMAVLVLVLKASRDVLSWAAIAVVLAVALNPAVDYLNNRGLSRGKGVAVVVAGFVLVLALFGVTVVPMFVSQGRALVEAAPGMLDRFQHSRFVSWDADHFRLVDALKTYAQSGASTAAEPLFGIVRGALEAVAATVTTLVLTIFMLLFGRDLFQAALAWVEPYHRARTEQLTGLIRKKVGGYVSGTLLIASIGGVVTAVTELFLGVPWFLPLGLVMAFLGIIPFIGPVLGGALVVLTTLAAKGSKAALIALVVFFVYQQVENHLLQPLVQRRTIRMNPLAIALAMLVATSVAGILGTLLALPVAGAAQVLLHDALARRQARFRRLAPTHQLDLFEEATAPSGSGMIEQPTPEARH